MCLHRVLIRGVYGTQKYVVHRQQSAAPQHLRTLSCVSRCDVEFSLSVTCNHAAHTRVHHRVRSDQGLRLATK